MNKDQTESSAQESSQLSQEELDRASLIAESLRKRTLASTADKKTLNISSMDLDDRILEYLLSECSDLFTDATSIDLSNNPKITMLPRAIGKITNLKALVANNCNIVDIEPALSLRLKKLSLDNNALGNHCLEKISKSVALEALEELSLANCGLTSVGTISGLGELKKLCLTSNKIGNRSLESICGSESLANLEELSLSGCKNNRCDPDCRP